jgi:hypothetical protein
MRILSLVPLFTLMLVISPASGHACSRDLSAIDQTISFEGIVVSADNDWAYIEVKKATSGSNVGEHFVAKQKSQTTCNPNMEKGMTLSFSGNTTTSYKNMPIIEGIIHPLATSHAENNVQDIVPGTLIDRCAPWDGAAFSIHLENNINVSIYEDFKKIEKQKGTSHFKTTGPGEMKQGATSIFSCDQTGQNCTRINGIVSITRVNGDSVSGLIEIPETNARHMFQVQYDRAQQALCG